MNKDQNLGILRTLNIRPTAAVTTVQRRRNFLHCRRALSTDGGAQSTRSQFNNPRFMHRPNPPLLNNGGRALSAAVDCLFVTDEPTDNTMSRCCRLAVQRRDKVNTMQQQAAQRNTTMWKPYVKLKAITRAPAVTPPPAIRRPSTTPVAVVLNFNSKCRVAKHGRLCTPSYNMQTPRAANDSKQSERCMILTLAYSLLCHMNRERESTSVFNAPRCPMIISLSGRPFLSLATIRSRHSE